MATLAHALPRVRRSLAYDAVSIIVGSLVVAALSQLSMRLPFTPVPITGQTLAVLLVGASLGSVRGAASLLLYLGEAAVGLPVLAEGKSGALHLVSVDPLHTTGGYLWGFVVAAFVVGFLAERGWDRNFSSAVTAMLIGDILIFALGVTWLAAAIDVPLQAPGNTFNDALEFGLYPFVIGDISKIVLAAAALPGAWKLLRRER